MCIRDSGGGGGGKGGGSVNPPTSTMTEFISNATVVDQKTGKVYVGTVDLRPTLERIKSGGSYPHRNDGSTFENRPDKVTGQRGLPVQGRGYYTEYVHPSVGIASPGPQRIVTGKAGEVYYTPDHYASFIRLNP
ncbi:Filamentous hemagglutinin family outer membrane protein [Pseudomonas cichorii]|uniref:Filamentous hemagglutinin family outer membrane protein n=1 Tax=Pseudomonas cichorii TaxID=36746 RepID=A0A3M4LNA4_PSECI|nr:ribonuclease domain-containing protein [Pseudomonas cichorii]RMQ42674.1 Filamentous hemagglutinin family outer membrane protein [Pseudomonas cichorii]